MRRELRPNRSICARIPTGRHHLVTSARKIRTVQNIEVAKGHDPCARDVMPAGIYPMRSPPRQRAVVR